jgi:integrase
MGCVFRRGRIYWLKYHRNGKPYSESSRSQIKAVAEQLLKRREGEIADGKVPGIVFDRVTLKELAEDLLVDYRINQKRSIDKTERSVKKLQSEFGGLKATQVTTASVKRYIEKRMNEGAANATINRELAALKRMYKLGLMCTPPKVSQVPYIPMLKEDNVRTGFFEHDQFQKVLRHLPEYLRPIAFYAYCSGWRKQEILSLTWDQVDLNQGLARLVPQKSKNGEGRTLYLEPDLWQTMKDLHRKRAFGCSHVFHVDGERIKDFRKAWDTACTKAGISGMLFHDLRRTAVRNMVRAGIPERVAMSVSGHKTRSVFDRYNIVSPDDLKKAAVMRQEYREKQSEQLQFSYNRPFEAKRATTLRVVTP